ncbi:hypothetical protein MSG28_008092 [Choristoneura fumiferana]|uniref:Uncharacterized protein n=1 Tax=Choristoneura fumiferana TaxID=7141 RepID=A0ACC0JA41_CHOFU|nr:hypothetical protein MSG28_008092 [Choristoneura fumiferana]
MARGGELQRAVKAPIAVSDQSFGFGFGQNAAEIASRPLAALASGALGLIRARSAGCIGGRPSRDQRQ